MDMCSTQVFNQSINESVPGRGDDFKAESSLVVQAGLDGAQSEILLHDSQGVLGPLPVHKLVVLLRKPPPVSTHR
jgi:hypothetical protein